MHERLMDSFTYTLQSYEFSSEIIFSQIFNKKYAKMIQHVNTLFNTVPIAPHRFGISDMNQGNKTTASGVQDEKWVTERIETRASGGMVNFCWILLN